VTGTTDIPDDPWEQAARRIDQDAHAEAAQRIAEEIAEVVIRTREAGVVDETILAQLQDAADALREGLT
jgi:hypothetical protein